MRNYARIRFSEPVLIAGNEVQFLDTAKATIQRDGDYFLIDTEGKTEVNKPAEKREVHVSNVRWAEPMPSAKFDAYDTALTRSTKKPAT